MSAASRVRNIKRCGLYFVSSMRWSVNCVTLAFSLNLVPKHCWLVNFSTKIQKQAIQCLCIQDVLGQPPETVSKINVQVQMCDIVHVACTCHVASKSGTRGIGAVEDATHRAPHHVERCALPTTWRGAHARRARTTPRMRATAYRTLMPKLMHHACATIQDTRVLYRHRMHEGNECRASPTYCVDNGQHV